jgi:hypothetical protein
MKIKTLNLILFLVCFAVSSFLATAQNFSPVDAALSGAWTFDSAEVQERPAGTSEDYVTRKVAQDEFWQKSFLINVPTQIVFMGDLMAHISHPSWAQSVAVGMNNGLLEFRKYQETLEDYHKIPKLSEMTSYQVITPAFSLEQNKNRIQLQCNYSDSDTEGNSVEGILTISYKRFQ